MQYPPRVGTFFRRSLLALALICWGILLSTEFGPRIGAVCRDGWVSGSVGSGTCSSHGGVRSWRTAKASGWRAEPLARFFLVMTGNIAMLAFLVWHYKVYPPPPAPTPPTPPQAQPKPWDHSQFGEPTPTTPPKQKRRRRRRRHR